MPPRSGYDLSDDPDDVGSEDDDAASSSSERESVSTMEEDDEGHMDEEDEDAGEGDEDGSSDGIVDDSGEAEAVQRAIRNRLNADGDDRLSRHLHMSQRQASFGDDSADGADDFQGTSSDEDRGAEDGDASLLSSGSSSDGAEDAEGKGAMAILFKQRPPMVKKRPSLTRSNAVVPPPAPEEVAAQSLSAGSGAPPALDLTEVAGAEVPQAAPAEAGVMTPATEVPEESLSPLERIFLFAKSEMAYHRVLVSRSLPDWIQEVELSDAVEYIIPLLHGLGTDGENRRLESPWIHADCNFCQNSRCAARSHPSSAASCGSSSAIVRSPGWRQKRTVPQRTQASVPPDPKSPSTHSPRFSALFY